MLAAVLVFSACSFDYGNAETKNEKPDIVMRDVQYVRVRGGDPLVRFEAEYAERYEEKKLMILETFSFEQFENQNEINAAGKAGEASVELDSGNIKLTGGVHISVESEDVIIETSALNWHDREKQLSGNSGDAVEIFRSDGTGFTGRGFSASVRDRTWVFSGGANGVYVDADDAESAEGESGETEE